MKFNLKAVGVLACGLGLVSISLPTAEAAVAIPQITNIKNTAGGLTGGINVFSNIPFGVDENGVYANNNVAVYTLVGGGTNNGAGVSVGISNGENGITSTQGGANVDLDNATPAHPIFSTIGNASGRLENGNAIRLSLWMRSDPTNPVTKQPNVEPVLKIELWKEALSGNADYNGVAFPGYGDRIWDTDQNAGQPVHMAAGQSQASWVDINNNGVTSGGRPVAASLVTNEWRRVETTLIVDDDPLNDGFGWGIGAELFNVTAVEEIRAVMFVGDYGGPDLTNGGSFFIDNLMVEVFKTQAAMLATPNPNGAPIEVVGLPGDYNENNIVDAADYTRWRDHLGSATALPNDDTAGVGQDDYTRWKTNFGTSLPGGGSVSAAAVPEPSALMLVISVLLGSVAIRRNK
jgi:hypothetical protein